MDIFEEAYEKKSPQVEFIYKQTKLNADINAVYSSYNVCFQVEDIVIHPVIAAFINEKVRDDIDLNRFE